MLPFIPRNHFCMLLFAPCSEVINLVAGVPKLLQTSENTVYVCVVSPIISREI